MTTFTQTVEEILDKLGTEISEHPKGRGPARAYRQAVQSLTTLHEKAVLEAEIRGMDTVNDCHGCVDNNEGLAEYQQKLESKLKERSV